MLDFEKVVENLVRTRNLEREDILNVFKAVVEDAVKKYYNTNVEFQMGKEMKVIVYKKVVRKVNDPANEISIQEAKKYDFQAIEGSEVKVPIPLENLPRAVVYRIRDKFLEKLKDREKQIILMDFSKRIGQIVRGKVQRINKKDNSVILAIERSDAEGKLSLNEMLPSEFEKIKQGETKKADEVHIKSSE